MPSGDRATPGAPLDNPGQRFDSDALLGISAPARRERSACLARDLADPRRYPRRRHHEPQPAKLTRDIPGIAGLVSGSGASTDRSGRGRTQLREADRRYEGISGGTGEPLAWVRCPGA